jgi:hypothetical protein
MLHTADIRDTMSYLHTTAMSYLHTTAMKPMYALWFGRKGESAARTKPLCINLRDQARVFAYTHYT